jgi:hypothetical protein
MSERKAGKTPDPRAQEPTKQGEYKRGPRPEPRKEPSADPERDKYASRSGDRDSAGREPRNIEGEGDTYGDFLRDGDADGGADDKGDRDA